jgi:two-component system, chemotaxis family, chemotaxis protein CheY
LARKILLADDSVTAQNMGRKILADAGYEVITVNNGSAALKKIAEAKPDLIVLDVYMPGYSGLEVCQRLKEAQETSRIPVLLTVGKLEPFKPEEAKRVRAEGYIVKPFEASELLSALSKLEDKIVPRPEPSKPGRFARANAALDEGRYDKTVAMEEDSGWKNRIGFPSKKKKPAEEEEADESSIYNAVNKDLRTVVDHKPGHPAQEAKAEDSLVDLGALAPEGLPKDVTPEEIAALAAAAAQVKGKLSDSTFSEPAPEPPTLVAAEVKPAQAPTAEAQFAEARLADAQMAETKLAEIKLAEIRTEENTEKPEAQSTAEETKEFAAPAATFAAQRPEEQVETSAHKLVEAVKEGGSSAPTPAEMMAAIAGLVPETIASPDASSGNGSGAHTVSDQRTPDVPADALAQHRPAEEPVTMAAAAGAGFGGSVSRWTAVAATLAPDEAAISLEHEMQKAHAAFAAAEVAHAAFVAPVPEVQPVAEAAAATPVSVPVEAAEPAEAPAPVSEGIRSELVHDMSVVASATTEAVTAAVKEFEKVAAYVGSQPAAEPPTQAAPEPAPVEAPRPVSEPVSQPASEVPQTVEAKAEEKPIVEAVAPQSETTRMEASEGEYAKEYAPPLVAEQKHENPQQEEPRQEEPKLEEQKQEDQKYEEPAPVMAVATPSAEQTPAVIEEKPEVAGSAVTSEISANQISANQISLEQIVAQQTVAEPNSADQTAAADQSSTSPVSSDVAEHAPTGERAAGSTKDVTKKESEIAETTAAAWASWRRIRESGDSKPTPAELDESKRQAPEEAAEEKTPSPQDGAAMAVAAGAEQSPEEAPAASEDSGDIANIVDSVLADMRPRIVEEISRKLGKKK